jgi:hypothetical protein
MEHNTNFPAAAATDEPAVPATWVESRPDCFSAALGCGADIRPGRLVRQDGWTPEAMCTFLEALAESGCVRSAAQAAGRSPRSAYKLRRSTKGRAFHLAWEAALLLARRRLADDLLSRALHGSVRTIRRNGEVWGEEHRFNDRLAMAMLTRLDRLAESNDGLHAPARFVAEEFDQFLEHVRADGRGAADFVDSRMELGYRGHAESHILERADNYRDYGVGLPDEIDVSDLDPADRDSWTDEQAERAERACLLEDEESDEPDAEMVAALGFDPAALRASLAR